MRTVDFGKRLVKVQRAFWKTFLVLKAINNYVSMMSVTFRTSNIEALII